MAIYRDGKRLEGDEADKAMKAHMARFNPSGGGSPQEAKRSGGSNGKGGKRSYDPMTERDLLERAQAKYNTDDRYGYYNNRGQYVGFFQDATDGGGMNTTDTFFQGAGPISTLLNVAKIRPSGMSQERDDAGDYIVPRADIGFRDLADMTNRGGPQYSGGQYQGGGTLSALGNTLDMIGGRKPTERVRLDRTGNYDASFYIPSTYSQPKRDEAKKKELLKFLMGM